MKKHYKLVSKYSLLFIILTFGTANLPGQTTNKSQEKVIYLSPLPGSSLVTPQSNIIIRFSGKKSPFINTATFFNVYGSVSGKHTGNVILAEDQTTLLFKPDQPFALNEKVTVKLNNSAITLSWHKSQLSEFSFYTSKSNLNAFYKPALINESEFANNIRPGNNKQKPLEQMKLNKNTALPSDFPVLTVDEQKSFNIQDVLDKLNKVFADI